MNKKDAQSGQVLQGVKQKRILFLNPPGKQIYIRDYYCSKISKAYYLPQPVDLLTQTSFFSKDQYELNVLDAIAEKLDITTTFSRIEAFAPDYIIGLIGAASLDEDRLFYRQLKERSPACQLFCSGDILLEEPEKVMDDYEWLDGIILDFYKPGPLKYIETGSVIKGFVAREKMVETQPAGDKYQKMVALAYPKHELFNNKKYRMPFMTEHPMATVLTNYACPFPCTFCIMSHLEFKSRDATSIIEELEVLHQLGVKFIYFSDQTFYIVPKVMDEVLDHMITNQMGFKWMCFSRVDIMTEDRLIKMKKAGCQIIMYGVEWAEEKYLEKYKKQYTTEQIKTAFKLTRKVGIKRLGTFLMGVPGQTKESIENTMDFAIEIDADYASFNVAVPRVNTSFRDEALAEGLISEDNKIMDQSGSFFAMGTGELSQAELAQLKKRAYRKFYLRPSYILGRIKSLSSWQEFKNHLYEGWFVIKSHVMS